MKNIKVKLIKKDDSNTDKKQSTDSCKEMDKIMQELEDYFYLTQVLGVPLK